MSKIGQSIVGNLDYHQEQNLMLDYNLQIMSLVNFASKLTTQKNFKWMDLWNKIKISNRSGAVFIPESELGTLIDWLMSCQHDRDYAEDEEVDHVVF